MGKVIHSQCEFYTMEKKSKIHSYSRWGDSDSESEDDDAVGKEEHNDSFSGQELSKDEQSEQSDAKAEIGGGQDGSGDAQCGVQNTSGGSKHEDDDSEENNEDPEMRQLFNLLDRWIQIESAFAWFDQVFDISQRRG